MLRDRGVLAQDGVARFGELRKGSARPMTSRQKG